MKMSIANRLVTTKGSASMTTASSAKPKHAGMTEPAHYRAPPPARPVGLKRERQEKHQEDHNQS